MAIGNWAVGFPKTTRGRGGCSCGSRVLKKGKYAIGISFRSFHLVSVIYLKKSDSPEKSLHGTHDEEGTMKHNWSARCQYNVTGRVSMWACDMLSQ